MSQAILTRPDLKKKATPILIQRPSRIHLISDDHKRKQVDGRSWRTVTTLRMARYTTASTSSARKRHNQKISEMESLARSRNGAIWKRIKPHFMIRKGLQQAAFDTPAGNPVKKILLKLNLSDHRSILTDSKESLKMVMDVPDSSRLTRFITTCSYPTDKYKDIMKAQSGVAEEVRILVSNLVFTFLRELWTSSRVPSNFDDRHTALLELIIRHEKNELAWGEKYEFQNYELKCREVKINNLKMELEKVVKERDELKVKIEKWEESSKGLNKILNSQMSAKDKNGLGYGTQLDEMSNKSETDSEISMSVFEVRSSDEEITPANNRFSKADGYHAIPPPITGNFLTPRADISFAGLDEYAIRRKIIESKTTELNTNTSKSKTSETVGIQQDEVKVKKSG
ncbi:hypothetical protein Tco_1532501 [Tanacetum coccineum]